VAKAHGKFKGLYKSGAVRRFRTTTPSDLPGTPRKKRRDRRCRNRPPLHKDKPCARTSPSQDAPLGCPGRIPNAAFLAKPVAWRPLCCHKLIKIKAPPNSTSEATRGQSLQESRCQSVCPSECACH